MLKSLNDNFQKNMKKLKEAHEKAMNDLKSQHDAALAKKQAEIDQLQAMIAKLKSDIKSLEDQKKGVEDALEVEVGKRADAEARIQGAIDECQRVQNEYAQRSQILEEEFDIKERTMKARLKEEMENLIREHIAETDSIQQEFMKTQELMEEKYKQLEVRYEELQMIYDGRPSRPEDMQLIQQIQQELQKKDQALKQAHEDMKFYKLELINREENFNNMFGKHPTVGVMDPLVSQTFIF